MESIVSLNGASWKLFCWLWFLLAWTSQFMHIYKWTNFSEQRKCWPSIVYTLFICTVLQSWDWEPGESGKGSQKWMHIEIMVYKKQAVKLIEGVRVFGMTSLRKSPGMVQHIIDPQENQFLPKYLFLIYLYLPWWKKESSWIKL